MGIETKIKSLGVPQTKILEFSFSTGHFEKWPKRAVSLSFFSGNIANIIPGSPLKKMIPLMGVHGDPRWLMDYKKLYTKYKEKLSDRF